MKLIEYKYRGLKTADELGYTNPEAQGILYNAYLLKYYNKNYEVKTREIGIPVKSSWNIDNYIKQNFTKLF